MENLFNGFLALTWQQMVMMGVGGLLIYLAVVKEYEPSLLLPMGFGTLLVNIPMTAALTQATNGTVIPGAVSVLFDAGIANEMFPLLIFIGIGAMMDFSPMIERPVYALFGLTAQAGIFLTMGLAMLLGFLIGALFGVVNGFIIAYTGMPPFVVTLATQFIGRGVAYVYANGQPIRCLVDEFNVIGTGYLGFIPIPVVISLVLFIIMVIVLGQSKFGRHLYAVGGNEEAARFSGISIKKVKIIVYTLSGIFSSIAGIVPAARMYSGQPVAGQGAEMDAIAASVLGGVSFLGGVGKLGGVMVGILVIQFMSNGLNLLNVNSFWQYIVKGVIILAAVYLDIIRKSRQKF